MRKVLIVAYYVPPLGMSGVMRVTKLAKFLPEFGWQPVILTVKPISYYHYDPELLNDLKGIKIFHSESFDPARLLYHFRKQKKIEEFINRRERGDTREYERNISGENLEKTSAVSDISAVKVPWFMRFKGTGPSFINYLLFPDAKALWIPFAYRLGRRVIEQEQPSLIFASAPPYSALLLGVYLKRFARIPLVSDFRDPYPTGLVPPPIHFRYPVQQLRRYILNNSDQVIAVNQGTAQKLEKPATIIENGYDPEEFKTQISKLKTTTTLSLPHLWGEDRRRGNFLYILYSGNVWENERELFTFLEATKTITNLKTIIAGRTSPDCLNRLKNYSNAEYLGVLPHQEVMSLMKSVDILLYLTKPNQPVGLKLYEYFGSGKPILAVCESCNEATRLIEHHNAGLSSTLEPEEIKATVKEIIDQKDSFINKPIEWYNRKNQAQRLAELFNQLV
jgi:Glycosyltransferase Family 4/Glycosyl transferases group 1